LARSASRASSASAGPPGSSLEQVQPPQLQPPRHHLAQRRPRRHPHRHRQHSPQQSVTNVAIYPAVADAGNPSYTAEHASLLCAIHFPRTWTAGVNKTPVIIVPGTGANGGSNFRSNFAKLLTNSGLADPMWLNIPPALCAMSRLRTLSMSRTRFATHMG
jgi:hypothetical protein